MLKITSVIVCPLVGGSVLRCVPWLEGWWIQLFVNFQTSSNTIGELLTVDRCSLLLSLPGLDLQLGFRWTFPQTNSLFLGLEHDDPAVL